MDKGFSVHKHIVMNNRKGFQFWAIHHQRAALYEELSKEWVALERFKGDRLPLEIVSQEIKKMVMLANEPNLGIKVIETGVIKQSPFYKVLNIALSPSLDHRIDLPLVFMLRLIGHYFQILTEVVSIELQECRDRIKINFTPNLPDFFSYHQIEGAMFGFTRLMGHFKNVWPTHVAFKHVPQWIDFCLYLKSFKCIPEFLKHHNQLVYSLDSLSAEHSDLVQINPIIHAIEKQFQNIHYQEKIEILLLTTLGFIQPSRQNIAGFLNISVKTMQRRLNEEEVSFNEILLNVRKKRVMDYLSLQQFTIKQIALLLGYKAKSQFLKAFQQWYGMTPQQYKESGLLPARMD